MRKLIVVATGLAVLGFSVPTLTAAKAEETVVIKRHHDRDWHRGWRGEADRRIVIERGHDRGLHRGWNHDRY
jgi:hypothetical protein